MRIGKVKTTAISVIEEETERLAKAKLCHSCKEKRTELRSTKNRHNIIMACTNPKCFAFVNIDQLHTWKR